MTPVLSSHRCPICPHHSYLELVYVRDGEDFWVCPVCSMTYTLPTARVGEGKP